MNDPAELQQFAEVLADTPWGLYAFRQGPDGAVSLPYASAGFGRLLGVDPAALREDARALFDRLTAEDATRLRETLARSARSLEPWCDEFQVHRPDGSVVWIEGSSTPTREPDGGTVWKGVCQDVSRRRRVEAQLGAAHGLQHLLLSQAPVSIAMFDRDLVYLAASRRWQETFGDGRGDVVGRHHYDVNPDIPERWKAAHREGLAGRVTSEDNDRWELADGARLWLRWAIHPWRDGEGNVGGIIIFAEDITRRKEAERAVGASEQRLTAIIRSAMDGIITVDESQTILLANPAAERMFGYEPGTLIGLPLEILIPSRHRAGHAHDVVAFGATGVTHRTMKSLGVVHGVRADGEEFRLEASISQIELDGRKLYTVIHRDVSERLRAEAALLEEEARFRQLAESIREVFWLTDVAKQRVVYISPAYETIWGRSCQSLYDEPMTWMDAIHPDDRSSVRHAALTQQEVDGYDLQYRVVRPDGSLRWVHDRAFAVRDAAGRVVRIAGVAEDITERRRLEEQFQQTQKMESVGRLAGGVAHDFNNLLTVIMSSGELLREGFDAADSGEMVEDILEASRRGASLTRQLLAFTRQEVVEPRVLDLAGVVSDTEKLLRRLIGEDVALTTHLDRAAPVRVDPGQWTQVLLNLAVNARDAMPLGGRLQIAIRAHAVGEARARPELPPGLYTVLEVSDSGSGMTPEVRSRIFEPFFTTKGRNKGTGLGLSVVYGVVQQAGGHIEVESALGAGTTFTLYLPAVQVVVSDAPLAVSPTLASGHETILLVEDEAAVRRVAMRILTSKGYRVLAAADGREALGALEGFAGPLDLLLTDVVMPELDGASLAEAVRARYPAVKVLFASGYIDESVTRRGVTGEGTAFLQKPYTPTVLLLRIREMLDG